ncbi:hypothetical protein Q7P35_006007 [Cladosporium inversicolor]
MQLYEGSYPRLTVVLTVLSWCWQTATALLTTFGAVVPQSFPPPPLLQQHLIPASVLGSVGNETHKKVFVQRGPEEEIEASGQAQLCRKLATPLISDKHAAPMHHVVSSIDTS